MKKILLLLLFAVSITFNMSAQSENYSFKDILSWAGGMDQKEDPTVMAVLPSRWKGTGYELTINEDKTFEMVFKGTRKVTGTVDVVNKPLKFIFSTPTADVGNCPHYTNLKVNKSVMVLKDCNERRKQFVRRIALEPGNLAGTKWQSDANTLEFYDGTSYSLSPGGNKETYSISASSLNLTGIGNMKVNEFNMKELLLEDKDGAVTTYKMIK